MSDIRPDRALSSMAQILLRRTPDDRLEPVIVQHVNIDKVVGDMDATAQRLSDI